MTQAQLVVASGRFQTRCAQRLPSTGHLVNACTFAFGTAERAYGSLVAEVRTAVEVFEEGGTSGGPAEDLLGNRAG